MATTRWLDETEQQAWRAFLIATTRLFEQLDRELREQHDMTLGDYEVLARLSESPGERLRMTVLADQARISKSRLTHQVRRLEDRGWVRREVCPTDRRGWEAVLTTAGRRKVEAAAPSHVGSVRCHLFDNLTPDQVDAIATGFRAVQDALSRSE